MSPTTSKPIPVLDLSPEIETLWDELNAAIQDVLRSGQFIMGPELHAFENEVAAYLGVKHAIGVNSGTDALVIGLRALGVGNGDEVITTPFSFFATAESISIVGARPVFVDIDETFNLDPKLIEPAITPKTRAILPVHLYGRPAEMDEIKSIADRHGLLVIEDCAQSFGARYRGRQTGTIGQVGSFSFFPSKSLGAFGDGGLVATNDDGTAELARMLRAHGGKRKYHNEILGYNSRLDAVQAAVLRVKLPNIDVWNDGRRQAAKRYDQLLEGLPGLITPEISDGHVFHQYTIRLTTGDRNRVHQRLGEQGVGSMVYYPTPQDQLPVYQGQYPRLDVSDSLAKQVLSLPIWPSIQEQTQKRVVEALCHALN
jgi:dTDP-4-amino-4,6-dideoxygalactose transaminase